MKDKIIKYKVANTNIDKRFINKELDLQIVKSKSSCAQPLAQKQKLTRDYQLNL